MPPLVFAVDATIPDEPEWVATVSTITEDHRAIPGVMFGGWGPHLGHLVQAAGDTYWIDDLCTRTMPGDCDVNVNRRVGVFRNGVYGWKQLATIPLDGIQQNTAAVADTDLIYVYGMDSSAQRVIECRYELSGTHGCSAIDIATGALANYVGAALLGAARVVWWTNVVDGGGGSFSYIVNYGGGWNGPRTGPIGGYNDCGYAHVSMRPDGTVDAFCQVVAGLAPSWTFGTLVGTAPADLDEPVEWRNALVSPPGDPIISTNDLMVDTIGTSHLLARSQSGAAVYYAGTAASSYTRVAVLPATYRARWLPFDDRVALVRDVEGSQVRVAISPPSPSTFEISTWESIEVPMPSVGDIYAIYPIATTYQRSAPWRLEFVVVGSTDERRAMHVAISRSDVGR